MDAGLAELVVAVAGIGDHVAFQGSTSVTLGDTDGVELEGGSLGIDGLHAPEEPEFLGEAVLHFRHGKDAVDGGGVACQCITGDAASALADLQEREQRVLLLHLVGSCVAGSLCLVALECVGEAVGDIGG